MLYASYQAIDDFLAPLRTAALAGTGLPRLNSVPFANVLRSQMAFMEMVSRFRLSHERPAYGIHRVRVGNRDVRVTEEVALDLPFGNLLRFRRDIDTEQPKVLVAAPLSGHFATLLAGTVRTLLKDHDVYITDWKNARDVPVSDGDFPG